MADEKLIDPLDDLREEIRAEEAAAAAKTDTPAAATEPEPADDADEEAQEAIEGRAPDDQPEPKAPKSAKTKEPDKDKLVPIARINEETAKRRKAERRLDQLEAEIEALRNPPAKAPDGTRQPTHDEILAQAREQVRQEMVLEEFVNSGNKEYTREAFEKVCSELHDLGAPPNLVNIAIEATGSPSLAAKAIYLLGQEDATQIEAFYAMSPLRQAAHLARYATARSRRSQEEPETRQRTRPAQVEEEAEPPAPIAPIRGNGRVPDGLGDDVPDDVFTERFDKLMDARHARRH